MVDPFERNPGPEWMRSLAESPGGVRARGFLRRFLLSFGLLMALTVGGAVYLEPEALQHHDYESRARIFGMPVFATGRTAHGFVALGGQARGIFAIGGVAEGVFALGGVAIGVIAFGGTTAGLLAVGGLVLAWRAFGGVAIGHAAFGAVAIAVYPFGGAKIRLGARGAGSNPTGR
jgi:hypothetical protein